MLMFVHLADYLQTKARFSITELKVVEQKCAFLNLRAGEKLLECGTVWTYHAFVCSGLTRGYRQDLFGEIQTVLFAPENYWTGDRQSLLTGEPSNLEIVAETNCEIILIKHEDYNALCITLPPFNEFMSNLIQRNLDSRQSQIKDNILSDEEKVKNFLQKYPTVIGRTDIKNIASFLKMDCNTLENILLHIS